MDPIKEISSLEPGKRALSFFQEFRDFAFKGNVIDLAVGVIIGTAFGALIKSLVENVLMPLIGLVLPGPEGYLGWKLTIGAKVIPYGQFVGQLVTFLLVALAVFLFIVKLVGWLTRSRQAQTAAPAPPTKDQELLTEIRDLLRQKCA
jgi:large conductance mechanosensitive channel